jgi:hypothetical protein
MQLTVSDYKIETTTIPDGRNAKRVKYPTAAAAGVSRELCMIIS